MADNQLSDFLHPERYPDWADQYRPQMRYKGFGRALLSNNGKHSLEDIRGDAHSCSSSSSSRAGSSGRSRVRGISSS